METLIISADKDKLTALKSFLEEMNITFEVKKTKVKKKDRPYDPAFVKKILERGESARRGNTITIDPNDLWGSLGLK